MHVCLGYRGVSLGLYGYLGSMDSRFRVSDPTREDYLDNKKQKLNGHYNEGVRVQALESIPKTQWARNDSCAYIYIYMFMTLNPQP